MRKIALNGFLALTSVLLAASAAQAEGWSVTKKPSDGVCIAGRDGVDKATKTKNAIALGLYMDPHGLNLVITLTSQDWAFTKDQAIIAQILLVGVDGNTLSLRSRWTGDGHTLTSTFDKARPLVNAFGDSPAFTLQTEPDTGVTFDTPNAALALASAEECLNAK